MRKTGRYYIINIVTEIVFMASCALLVTIEALTPPWRPFVCLGLVGFGFGGKISGALLALLASVSQEQRATLVSGIWPFRSTEMVVGLTITSVIFQTLLKSDFKMDLAGHYDAGALIPNAEEHYDATQSFGPGLKAPITNSYMDALRGVFCLTLGEVVLAAACSLCMENNTIKK